MCYNFVSCDVVVIVASVSLPYTFLHLKLSTSPSRSSGAHGRSHHCLQQNLKCGMRFGLEYIMACWLLRSPECGARQMHGGMLLLMRLKCSPTQEHPGRGARQAHSWHSDAPHVQPNKSIAARGKRIIAFCWAGKCIIAFWCGPTQEHRCRGARQAHQCIMLSRQCIMAF